MSQLTNQFANMLQKRRTPVIEFSRVAFVIGVLLLVLTLFMLPPAATDIAAGNPEGQLKPWRKPELVRLSITDTRGGILCDPLEDIPVPRQQLGSLRT